MSSDSVRPCTRYVRLGVGRRSLESSGNALRPRVESERQRAAPARSRANKQKRNRAIGTVFSLSLSPKLKAHFCTSLACLLGPPTSRRPPALRWLPAAAPRVTAPQGSRQPRPPRPPPLAPRRAPCLSRGRCRQARPPPDWGQGFGSVSLRLHLNLGVSRLGGLHLQPVVGGEVGRALDRHGAGALVEEVVRDAALRVQVGVERERRDEQLR